MMQEHTLPPVSANPDRPTVTPRRRVLILVLVVAAVIGVVGWSVARPKAKAKSLPVSDTPHVMGKRIEFSDRFAKRIGLQTAEARKMDLVPTVAVVGTVTFDPQHVARIGTRLRGLVRNVRHFEGDAVKRGTLLAEIDSPELGEAQASVTMLQAQAEAARRNADRERDLAEHKLTTLKESEEASANKDAVRALLSAARQKVAALAGTNSESPSRALGVHALMAPLDGTIVERRISKGQLVQADHTAFVVANLDFLWVELAVFERHLAQIHEGDIVEISPMGSKTEVHRGRVAHVSSVLDEDTRSATIRVEIENKNRKLRPGQAVDATIHAASAAVHGGTVIPSSAVTQVDGKATVFIADTPNSVAATTVKLGAASGHEQQIEEGIQPGQRVVVTGTFELKSELFR